MPTYLSLIRWTPSGARKLDELPARLERVRRVMATQGITFREFYLLLGAFDAVLLCDAADDEAYFSVITELQSAGNFTATTLKAFGGSEYERIVASQSAVRAQIRRQERLSKLQLQVIERDPLSPAA
jgi:uncharacterized protein with GYD domain